MYALKTIFFVAFSFIQVFTLSAQSTNIISYQDFEKIKFNSHTVKELIAVSDYEAFLEENYGPPTNKECYENPMTTYGCEIDYNGFELIFDYINVLSRITVSGGSNTIFYNGKQLRVGMSIYELKGIFPNSYSERYTVKLDGNTELYMRVFVNKQFSRSLIRFKLNESLNIVSEISIGFEGEG